MGRFTYSSIGTLCRLPFTGYPLQVPNYQTFPDKKQNYHITIMKLIPGTPYASLLDKLLDTLLLLGPQ